MPYINVRMTAPLTPEKESALTAAFGRDIEAFPGKTERWLNWVRMLRMRSVLRILPIASWLTPLL